MKRYPLPFRSGVKGHLAPTPEMILLWAVLRTMRLQLELLYPREKTRWN